MCLGTRFVPRRRGGTSFDSPLQSQSGATFRGFAALDDIWGVDTAMCTLLVVNSCKYLRFTECAFEDRSDNQIGVDNQHEGYLCSAWNSVRLKPGDTPWYISLEKLLATTVLCCHRPVYSVPANTTCFR